MFERVRWLHRRFHWRQIHFGRHACDVVFAIRLVNFLREIMQPDLLVLRMRLHEFRHHAPQRLILVVVHFELLELGNERIPATFGNADREHHKERIEPGFFNDHTVFSEIFGDERRRNALRRKLAVDVEPRRHNRCLDRVEHVEARLDAFAKAVPFVGRFQEPIFAPACAFVLKLAGAPRCEPPIFAKLFVDLRHRTAEIERFGNTFLHQCAAAWLLHHRSGHVTARDDGVLRAGARMHQIRFVKAREIKLQIHGVLHQNLRGLRQPREQLVRALCGKHHRVFARLAARPNRMHVLIHRVKRRVRQPRFVKVQVLNVALQLLFDCLNVVEHTVVSTLRDRHYTRS